MNKLQIRIAYADTDQMGMVYYGNYLTFFERGRTELFRQSGLVYTELEKRGFFFPVIYAECKYLAPARYDDIIDIETKLIEITAASVSYTYEIKCNGKLLVKGRTKHPFVNKDLKPIKFPKDIREILENHLEKE
ncbi:MAG: acyl-CoA thioesterase [Elusimicrobiota bacterium]|jgi:acyl-CoA thioester hydrolase|nr:acyl-CoA thioesterase [Elusimicrobiota bacterium]